MKFFPINGTSSLKILQNYALSKINTDRLSVGLNPVSISDNKAAQYHAAEILRIRAFISLEQEWVKTLHVIFFT